MTMHFLINGLLELFEATGHSTWLKYAQELQATQDALHHDINHGGYYTTSSDHEVLLAREKPSYDGAEPSGNANIGHESFETTHLDI